MCYSIQVFRLLPSSAQTLNLLQLINASFPQLFQEVLLHYHHVSFYLFQFLYLSLCFLFHQLFILLLPSFGVIFFQAFSYHFVESIYSSRIMICMHQQHLNSKNFNFFQVVPTVFVPLVHLFVAYMLHTQKIKNMA